VTNPAADRYLTDQVMTASPAELTAMLFDACVGAMKSAVRMHEAGEHLAAVPRLIKAQEILLELRSTLNPAAGDMATRLDALYTYAYGRLVEGNLRRDTDAVREAVDVVEPIQIAWRQSCLQLAA
jgi:flagellar protein FliS